MQAVRCFHASRDGQKSVRAGGSCERPGFIWPARVEATTRFIPTKIRPSNIAPEANPRFTRVGERARTASGRRVADEFQVLDHVFDARYTPCDRHDQLAVEVATHAAVERDDAILDVGMKP